MPSLTSWPWWRRVRRANTSSRAGYLPKLTYSAHWIADAGFRQAVASYLVRERAHVLEIRDDLDDLGPFRRVPPPRSRTTRAAARCRKSVLFDDRCMPVIAGGLAGL